MRCFQAMSEVGDLSVDACDALLAFRGQALVETPLLGCRQTPVEVDSRIRHVVAVGLLAETR